MTKNPYEPGTPAIAASKIDSETRSSGFVGSTLRATMQGARIGAFIGGPLSLLLIVPALALIAFGLAARGVWVLPQFLLSGVGLALFFVGLGGVIGAGLGVIADSIGLSRDRRSKSTAPAAVEPPGERASSGEILTSKIGLARRRRFFTFWLRFWLCIAAGVSVAASVAGFVAGKLAGRTVDRRLAAAVAAADRDDPAWRFDDLLASREQVPDQENSSRLMDNVLSLLPDGWLSDTKVLPGEEGTPMGDFKEALSRLEASAENVRLGDSVARSLRAELESQKEAIALARTLAGYRRGRHELEIGPTIIDTPLPQTQNARTVARLLMIDAATRAHNGDPDGALDSARAILGAARSIGDEPFLISALVRIAIGSVGLRSARRALAQTVPSEPALERIQQALTDELAHNILVIPIRGERAAHNELLRRMEEGELPISALSGDVNSDRLVPFPANSPFVRLWFDYQIAVLLEWMNDAVDIAKSPTADQPSRWQAWEANLVGVTRSRFGVYTSMLPLLLAPGLSASGTAYCSYQSELGATLVLIAAERHRRKTGQWPSSIEDIERTILPVAPIDPYSGRPLRMAHRDGQLFVYSIGPNGKDEHGEFDPKQWPKGGPDDVGARAWDVNLRSHPPAPKS
jgi:hypothetical protein